MLGQHNKTTIVIVGLVIILGVLVYSVTKLQSQVNEQKQVMAALIDGNLPVVKVGEENVPVYRFLYNEIIKLSNIPDTSIEDID